MPTGNHGISDSGLMGILVDVYHGGPGLEMPSVRPVRRWYARFRAYMNAVILFSVRHWLGYPGGIIFVAVFHTHGSKHLHAGHGQVDPKLVGAARCWGNNTPGILWANTAIIRTYTLFSGEHSWLGTSEFVPKQCT